MRSLVLLGLLGASLPASAHPAPVGKPGVRRRTVDLNAYRITQNAEYHNEAATSANPKLVVVKRDSYVETATALLKSVVPDATYRLVDDHYVGTNGIAHVNFKQTAHGLDIDNADFNVNIAPDGTVFSYGNSFFQGKIPEETPLRERDFSEATQALEKATSMLEIPVTGTATAEATEGTETFTLKGTSGAQKDPEARLVYFVKSDGELALTWRVETDVLDNWLLSYVDAKTNEEIHGVVDWVQDAKLRVYPWGVNDPDVGSRTVLTDPWDAVNSEFTWFGDGSTSYTDTRGNNAAAQTNPTGGSTWESNYRPASSTLDFEFDWSASWSPPSSYANASVVQLFYTANVYHDVLYDLGFTEAAGNFEKNNNGKGGLGNDFVILNSQDGSGTNNANFATPPDGQNGRMRMYRWTYSTPQRDCAFEAGVIIHEYTHGLSNRLTGGPANSNCLSTTEAGGMGEGWGDFMATAIRLQEGDTRNTDYSLGAWVYNNAAGIRNYLYSTKLTVNPYQYTTANTYNEVHDIGEIWATMLYEVLWNLIDKHGLSTAQKPTFDSNGVPTDGKFLTMKLVSDGMALQPCNPNFVQARDAILDADKALTGGDNACEIWTAFAKRGLGSGAAYGASRNRVGSNAIPSGVC
ncbi:extracellular elastinolytic metallo proteinase [Xylaria digitata]|nr:extracellular elastinolytic metallo proteinase [Xylaria digitata]